jgi:uncharacterized membrane protein YciS (DUF1049 family)
MILLGLLLMLACAALAVDAVVQNGQLVHGVAFNQSVSHLSLGAMFVAGAVLGLLFALGLLMFTGGIGRAGRKRRERRIAAREARAENEALREHNERLSAQLDAERTAGTYPEESAVGAGDGDGETAPIGGRHRAR